jgi:hypothetical protein
VTPLPSDGYVALAEVPEGGKYTLYGVPLGAVHVVFLRAGIPIDPSARTNYPSVVNVVAGSTVTGINGTV